jgi:hypothetical protein
LTMLVQMFHWENTIQGMQGQCWSWGFERRNTW